MINEKRCPSCDISWEREDTITQTFVKMYLSEGVPEKMSGLSVEEAAASTASDYGCRPGMHKHFGANMVGIETEDYDGVSWWLCTSCGVSHHRLNPKKTTMEFSIPKPNS